MSEVVVIKLAKRSLWVYKVGPEGLGEFSETEWKPDNLEQLLRTIKVKFQTTKVRVILADEISYNLEFKWPKKGEKPDRAAVKSELEGRVPDEIKEDNWDYDLVEQEDESYLVRVFVPVKGTFDVFMEVSKRVGLRIMLVVPEQFLGGGDDQMIKIAKMKISDKDEAFLGLTPEVEESILNKQISFGGEKKSREAEIAKETSEKTKSKGGTRKAVVVGGILLIIILLGLLWWLLQQRQKRPPKTYGSPTPSPSPTTVEASPSSNLNQSLNASSAAEASKSSRRSESINLGQYKLKIENGSGLPGEAGKVKEILVAEGFKEVETGNADRFDYQETEVKLKANLPDEVEKTIERALNDTYVLKVDREGLQSDADYDVLVIVGKLFVQEKGGEEE